MFFLRYILGIFWSTLMICCISCTEPQPEKRAADTSFLGEEQPLQESWNVSMKIFKEDKIHAVITAGHFAEYKKNDIITRHLDKGLEVTFFDSNGTSSSTLTADKGTVYDNNDMEAFDNVVITSEEAIIRTDYIKRFADKKKLWSDKYVVIQKQNETIRGYGFESDESLKNYTVFKASGESNF
ncbi:LPS export ABC transporter periplasmic protein LptC [Prosthecochloris sp.]|uniref:LPS export ABC transporter periplasmic protein LptC n=1 Tax=Prosthecochloris sp. TaxID=290513 RepID=UPI00260159CD|nr:LPS export ABC transporter periplasmic protein LptC [Prosthecochloris sp.]